MKKQTRLLLIAGGFFLFDQFLKWFSLNHFTSNHIYGGWVGWQPFLNSGVAFGIPLPSLITIILTAPIIILLTIFIWQNKEHSKPLIFVAIGALSNLVDRIFYQHTVDYFLFFTGVINLADIMIVGGFIFYILDWHKQKT